MSTKFRHPLFARLFARSSRAAEGKGLFGHREQLLAGCSGRVLEIGAGNGMNFSHYSDEVTQVVALEPEPYLRRLAEEAAEEWAVPIRVISGVAEELPFPKGSFDAVVLSLVLCSVRSPEKALREVLRVLRPGGELRFYEHVRADSQPLARLQRWFDHLWPHFSGGCHVSRETLRSICDAGFVFGRVDRFDFAPDLFSGMAAPHVLGVARKPFTPESAPETSAPPVAPEGGYAASRGARNGSPVPSPAFRT